MTNITKAIDFGGMPEYEVNQIEVNGIGYNSWTWGKIKNNIIIILFLENMYFIGLIIIIN